MPDERAFQTLQSSTEMCKTDITLLAIQARDLSGALFQRLSRNDGDIITIYNAMVNIFFQLYLSFKHNASETNKIDDWDEQIKVLDDLFYNRIMTKHEFVPAELIKYFDAFLEVLIKCGIYDLSSGEFHGKRGLD